MVEFEFNGYNSEEFGVIIASIEENDQLESRSLILGEKNKFRPRENHFGTTYEENLSFNIVLIKNPCKKSILPYLEATETITEKSKNTLIYDMISNNISLGVYNLNLNSLKILLDKSKEVNNTVEEIINGNLQ